MHEYALADAVIAAVRKTAADERLARVLRVEVRVGALQSIDEHTFARALDTVRPPDDARFAAVEFALSLVPVRCRCRPCGAEYGPEVGAEADAHGAEAIHFVPELAHSYLRCPRCQSPDFDILEGRGVTIGRIEGERDE